MFESFRGLRKFSRGYSDYIDLEKNSPRISLRLISHNFQG